VFCSVSLLSACFSQADKVLEPYNISPDLLDALLKNIKRRLTPQAIKIRADVEVMCFAYEGIDAIKEALLAAEALSTAEIPVKIKLVAPPLYVIMTQALNKEAGIALLQSACDTIGAMVKAKGGEVNIKTAPRAVSERDDRLLGLLMETLEKQNQEISGDDAEDE
jgi:translation initiation factor 2 subunit 1